MKETRRRKIKNIFRLHQWNSVQQTQQNPSVTKNGVYNIIYLTSSLVVDLEFHADTHSRELDIQEPQDTGDSNDSNVITTDKAQTITVLPSLSARVLKGRRAGTTTAAHDTVRTAERANSGSTSTKLLVRRSLGRGSRSAGVNGCTAGGTGTRDSDLGGQEGAAVTADPGMLGVGAVHQTVLQQEGSAVGDQGITLHLSDTDTTTLGTTLDGLAG
jgi:hypothetical protein